MRKCSKGSMGLRVDLLQIMLYGHLSRLQPFYESIHVAASELM